ncbi:uncharacterized protein [Narcine bancroftii]|uniref:uncharacterized protein isoform X1 n=1 Tax=Narcine bancroftii TaxID=1343680 RepID=UPI0038321983
MGVSEGFTWFSTASWGKGPRLCWNILCSNLHSQEDLRGLQPILGQWDQCGDWHRAVGREWGSRISVGTDTGLWGENGFWEPVNIPLSNRYILLDAVEGDDLTEAGSSDQVAGTEPGMVDQKVKRNAVVIGDSIVRNTDRRFCEPDRYARMVCCLPGARVRDISNRVQGILKGEGKQPDVLVHVGTNDIDKKEEVLKKDYRELGQKLRNRTARVVISGLLPVPSATEDKNGRLRKMNVWLRGWCKGQGFGFLDHWDLFWGRHDLYKKDGLHLNLKGVNILAARFSTAVRCGLN